MKIKILVLLLGCAFQVCGAESAWDDYLLNPNSENGNLLKEHLSQKVTKCDWGYNGNKNIVNEGDFYRLLEIIEAGNDTSLVIGLSIESCLDGGMLEDFYKSSSLFFDVNHIVFIGLINESYLTLGKAIQILQSLPESTVDKWDEQIIILNKRVALLKKATNNGIEKELATHIEKAINTIEKIKNSN